MKIREYGDGFDVEIVPVSAYWVRDNPELLGRPVILAINEGGHNCVEVDLLDVIEWVKENKPELLK
jgi:hypothetical protein